MGALLPLVVSLSIALATGWLGGRLVLAPPAADAPAPAEAEIVGLDALPGADLVVELPPIVTHLPGPERAWARLELALVTTDGLDAEAANRVHAHALAYLRTLGVHQIDSPSGFLFLREDLAVRAADLTDGAVTEVLVRAFLIE